MALIQKVQWRGEQFFKLATKANVRAMNMAAKHVERETKKALSHKGSYLPYKRGGKIHWSSTPPLPPATDTGTLKNSIMSDVRIVGVGVSGKVGPDIDQIAANADIGTDLNYGYWLELGTKNMQARPFLRPTLAKCKKEIRKIFRKQNR